MEFWVCVMGGITKWLLCWAWLPFLVGAPNTHSSDSVNMHAHKPHIVPICTDSCPFSPPSCHQLAYLSFFISQLSPAYHTAAVTGLLFFFYKANKSVLQSTGLQLALIFILWECTWAHVKQCGKMAAARGQHFTFTVSPENHCIQNIVESIQIFWKTC